MDKWFAIMVICATFAVSIPAAISVLTPKSDIQVCLGQSTAFTIMEWRDGDCVVKK